MTYLTWLTWIISFALGYAAFDAWKFLTTSGDDTAIVIVLITALTSPLLVIIGAYLQHRARRVVLTADEAAMAWVNAPLRGSLLVLEHELATEGALDDPTLLAAHRTEHGCAAGLPVREGHDEWVETKVDIRQRGQRTTLVYFLRLHGWGQAGNLTKIVSVDGTDRVVSYVAPDGWTFEVDPASRKPGSTATKGWMRAP